MKFCTQCGEQLDDNAVVCTKCGANLGAPTPTPAPAPQPVVNPWDHTAEFSADEIGEGKVFALSIFLLGPVGVLIALLAAKDNKFIAYHMRNYLKLIVVLAITSIANIIPVVGWFAFAVWAIIMTVIKVICIIDICRGKAKDPAIIRSMKFLGK